MKNKVCIILLLAVLSITCTLCACTFHTHAYGEWTVFKGATCTQDGIKERFCSCGEKQTTIIGATGHSYTSVVTNPNCTEGGFTTHTCTNCGDSYEDASTQATGHSYVSVVTAPTCTEQGYTTHTCSRCSDNYVDTYTNATGHSYTPVVTAPKCEEQGYTTHTCSNCSDSFVDTYVSATGHTEVIDSAVAATCSETGLTEGKHCSVCSTVIVKQTQTDIVEHNYQAGACTMCKRIDSVAKQAEIDAEYERHENRLAEIEEYYPSIISGLQERINNLKEANGITYVYSDSYCYDKISSLTTEISTLERKIASLSGSTNSSDVAECRRYEAQLIEKQNEQNMYYKCITINGLYDEITNIRAYYSEATSDENALHIANLEAIENKYTCASNGHTIVIDRAISPSCTEKGRTEGSHCSLCSWVIVPCQTIDELGHTESIIPAIESTCSSFGLTEGKECTLCGVTIVAQMETSKKDHTLSAPATCTTDQICIECAAVIDPKHHTYSDEWEIVLPATFTEDGLKQKRCQVCGEAGCHTVIPQQKLDYSLDSTGETYTCVGIGTVTDSKFIIPSYYSGKPVVAIGNSAFANNNNITDVTISTNIHVIGDDAFRNCSKLTNISADTLSSIGERAFYGCIALTSFEASAYIIQDGERATIYNTNIGKAAFKGCTALKTVNIQAQLYAPEGCTSASWASNGIGAYAFENCTSLIKCTFDVSYVGEDAFRNCSSLTSLTLLGIRSIPKGTFRGCSSLISLTLSGYAWVYTESYYEQTLYTSSPSNVAYYVVNYWGYVFTYKY